MSNQPAKPEMLGDERAAASENTNGGCEFLALCAGFTILLILTPWIAGLIGRLW